MLGDGVDGFGSFGEFDVDSLAELRRLVCY
jgi:hypothetical protein